MGRFLAKHSPLVILAALSILLAIFFEDFRKPVNLQRVGMRTCAIAVVAAGQTYVIISGGIDLSVGSVAALGGITGAVAMGAWGLPMPVGLVAGSLAGLLCGLINGALVTTARIPPFIATLGMMMMARGGAYLVSQGRPVYGIPRSFRYLGGSEVWWIPVVVAAVIAGVLAAVLTFTRYGRHLLATGGNITAARLSGVRVDGVRLGAYAVCGLLAGFAGLMLASRTSSGDPNAGMQMELDVIAACVIGGASLMGGEGSVLGAVAGALIMEVLRNVCNLVDLDVYWQPVLIGALIIALVSYDTWRRRRAGLLKE